MIKEVDERFEEGRELSFHLYEEADRALASWAVVQPYGQWRNLFRHSQSRTQPRSPNLAQAHQQIVDACLRDTLLTLSRMTDSPIKKRKEGEERKSLFRISNLLNDPEVLEAIRRDGSTCKQERAIEFIQRRAKWDKSIEAKNWEDSERQDLTGTPYELMKFRAELSRFRNCMLAHAASRDELGGLWLGRFRRMLLLCTAIAKASLLVFRGSEWAAKNSFREYRHAQIQLRRSISIEFLDPNASALARAFWERHFHLR